MLKRRYLFGGFAVVFAAAVAMTVVRCEFPASAFSSFSYIPHERPRVFVSHHPIRALPGQDLTIRLVPNLRPQDGAVTRAVAALRRGGSAEHQSNTCSSQTDGTFTCVFRLPAGDADFIYEGFLDLANGTRVKSRASYRFTATAALGSNRLITLREPIVDFADLRPTYRVDTAWVRDPMRDPATGAEQYAETQFIADTETAVYDGILQDPVYRWRDDQLGFYLYSDPGFTSSYYSGFDTRCGQNPWPNDSAFPSALDSMEAMGVLHRNAGVLGLEGTNTSNLPPPVTTYRDCAGDAVKRSGLGTFSVRGGVTQTASIAKHEFGHAAFGLGDEYPESDASRRVAAAPAPSFNDPDCCCESDDGSVVTFGAGTTVPGGETGVGAHAVWCVQLGGGVSSGLGGFGGGSTGLRPCTDPPMFPMSCGATPQAACPTLSGHCIQPQMWLGQLPPASLDTARPNVFTSQAECEASRASASIHPGVEDRERGLGECRELCGPTTSPCPCGEPAAWIIDTNPDIASAPAMTRPDSMASVTAERHGSTCAWCVETSLCVRWQRARGDTTDAAWNYCKAPPQNAAELERRSITLAHAIMEWIIELIEALTRNWRF